MTDGLYREPPKKRGEKEWTVESEKREVEKEGREEGEEEAEEWLR